MTVDYGAKTVQTSGVEPEPESLTFTDTTVEWGFMRGSAIYHRDTHLFEWDTRAERWYLDMIGHPSTQPDAWFMGTATCEVGR